MPRALTRSASLNLAQAKVRATHGWGNMMLGNNYAAALRLMTLPAAALLAVPAVATQPTIRTEPTLVLSGNVRGVRSDATTSHALAIEILDIKVRIRGTIAETVMTATFRNDGNDVLEGDFRFDMPTGSVMTGYALDIGGNMIDGVIAGRDQAREAYQRRVVQRIDPGLAEVTWADRFSTRIFPIPARGSRTIRLVMTSPIDPQAGYVLPMRPSGAVGRLTMRLESDSGRPAQVTLPGRFNAEWQGGVLAVDDWSGLLSGELRLSPAAPGGNAMTVSRHANGESFFDIEGASPSMPAAANNGPLHIFWDRSFSRADDDLAAEKALLEAWLEAHEPVGAVMLTLFDSGGAQTVRVADGAQLGVLLDDPHYGGGSSFAVLRDVPVAAGATCMLFSDGRVTLDSRAAFALPCRTHTIASGREVDRGWLTHVAARSGGSFIDLGSMTGAGALAALARGGTDIGRVVDDAGGVIDAVRVPAADGHFRLVGPMPDTGGVNLVRGTVSWRHYDRPTLASPLFSGTGALWASRHIAASANEMRTADLVAMARRYSVASPMASFIVLENPADYVEANIPPPTSYPKPLTDQYLAMRASADQARSVQQEARLGVVTGLWREQISWWEARYDGRGQHQGNGRGNEEQQREPRRDSQNATTDVPPPPPPPPPISPGVVAEVDSANIIVTGTRVVGQAQAPVEDATVQPLAGAMRREVAADASSDSREQNGARRNDDQIQATTALPEWSPARPWLAALDSAGDKWEDEQDRLAATHGALPLFWYDVAEWHFQKGRVAEARRAVASALDLPSRDNQTLSIVAARLQRYGDLDRAIALGEQLVDRENERPQPLRTLAVLLMQRADGHRVAGRSEAARTDLHRAIALLADAVLTVRREQYRGFEQTALMDANHAVQRYRALGGRDHALPARLVRMLDTDIRICIEWNTPRTDMDLHVTQPDGQEVYYGYRLSSNGGQLTADVTNGFGPEEYLLRVAAPGTYTIQTNSFSEDRANPNGPSTIAARIIRNFGRTNQTEQLVDVEMQPDAGGRQLVGRIVVR